MRSSLSPFILFLLIGLSACGPHQQSQTHSSPSKAVKSNSKTVKKMNSHKHSARNKRTNPKLSKETSSGSEPIAFSKSCNVPPTTIKWSGHIYYMKKKKTSFEPGMQFGYVKCSKGKYFQTKSDGKGIHTVYSNGDPRINHELVLGGKWGLTVYSVHR